MNLNKITQKYLEEFPGDLSGNPMQRQTPGVLYSSTQPVELKNPELLLFNEKLSEQIGLGKMHNHHFEFLAAQNLPSHLRTYATAYAGHQFGKWAGQLGDGRAIFAGEIENRLGKTTEIQWKGAGATPYSRFADGRAVLRSSLREYLMSEALFHLGVPSTRALSLCLTGEEVIRDEMYSGNPRPEKGAIIIRTAESFLRFGHFELLSAQKDYALLQKLADFSIQNYFTSISADKSVESYKKFFADICKKTALLIVEWMRIGFVHGVMNTDNMSILGLTIDLGPFSCLDEYNLNFTPNTTDLPGRRYAFGRQAQMAQWNLWQLANALFPLIKDEKFLEDTLNNFSDFFWQKHDEMLCQKFGFEQITAEDGDFFSYWQNEMQKWNADYTLFFTKLEAADEHSSAAHFQDIFYGETPTESFNRFLKLYFDRVSKNVQPESRKILMAKANPKFILRNYLLYECISELNEGKMVLLHKILQALERPYEEIHHEFSVKRPAKYDGTPGTSLLSCSS